MQSGQTNSTTKQSLVQCLRTYALIDQTQVAEWLIREQFVRPFVANVCIHFFFTWDNKEIYLSKQSERLEWNGLICIIYKYRYEIIIGYNKKGAK